jgi:hypothetical protein
LTDGDEVVAFREFGDVFDQLDWKFAEWVALYAGDLGGERLFDAFSFFGENEIADHGAVGEKLLQGIDNGEL